MKKQQARTIRPARVAPSVRRPRQLDYLWEGFLYGLGAPARLFDPLELRALYGQFDSVGYAWKSVEAAMSDAVVRYEREIARREEKEVQQATGRTALSADKGRRSIISSLQ